MSTEESHTFSMETVDEAGTTAVRASGEIDVASAPRIEELLLSLIDGGTPVRLDLSGVTFMDSSGLRALITARQRADEQSVGFGLASRSPAVDRLLQVTGLDAVFEQAD